MKYNSQKGGAILENVSPLTDISLVANIDRENARGYAIDAIKSRTDNIITNYDCADEIIRHIYEERQIQDTYKVITSSGLTRIKLEKPLTYQCFQAARGIITDYSGLADTDEDGLYDFEEIDCLSTLFTVDSYGEVVEYPTFAKCLNARQGKDFYVDVGLEKYKEILKRNNQYTTLSYLDHLLDTTRVLPINSDPVSKNGDGDFLDDKDDAEPLKNLFPGATEEHLMMIEESIEIINEHLSRLKKNFYRDEKLCADIEHSLGVLEKLHNSICYGSYEYDENDENDNVYVFVTLNYNYGPDNFLLSAAGLFSYVGEFISLMELAGELDNFDFSKLLDIIISAVNEKDIKILLENKALFKIFAEEIEALGIVSDCIGAYNFAKSIATYNSEDNRRTSVSIWLSVGNDIYFFNSLYDDEFNRTVIQTMLDFYDERKVDGFKFRLSDRGWKGK